MIEGYDPQNIDAIYSNLREIRCGMDGGAIGYHQRRDWLLATIDELVEFRLDYGDLPPVPTPRNTDHIREWDFIKLERWIVTAKQIIKEDANRKKPGP